jgi:hypothetical protein
VSSATAATHESPFTTHISSIENNHCLLPSNSGDLPRKNHVPGEIPGESGSKEAEEKA